MSETETEREPVEPEPLAYDDPNRCPATAGQGYYCTLPIDHEGDHDYSDDPYVAPESLAVPEPPADEDPLCPVCLGMGRVPRELQHAQTKAACEECGGLGMVRTGSIVPDQAILECDACVGKGWTAAVRPYVPEPSQTPEYARRY